MKFKIGVINHSEDLGESEDLIIEVLNIDFNSFCDKHSELLSQSDWYDSYVAYLYEVEAETEQEELSNYAQYINTKLIG